MGGCDVSRRLLTWPVSGGRCSVVCLLAVLVRLSVHRFVAFWLLDCLTLGYCLCTPEVELVARLLNVIILVHMLILSFVPVVNNCFAVHQSLQVSWGSMVHSDFSLSIGSGVICSVVAQNSSYDVCLSVELWLCAPILVAVQQATSVASSTHSGIDVTSMSSLSSTSLSRWGALFVEYKCCGGSSMCIHTNDRQRL